MANGWVFYYQNFSKKTRIKVSLCMIIGIIIGIYAMIASLYELIVYWNHNKLPPY